MLASLAPAELRCDNVRAYAIISSGGEDHVVGHGDLVGRTPTAAVIVDDPRVSEAHAVVSLRKGELHLLSLRRLIIANGTPTSEVKLAPGLVITLVDELELVVRDVVEPASVLAIVMPSGERQVLPQVASVTTSPPRLHGKLVPDARIALWSTGDAWRARIGDRTHAIGPGDVLGVDGEQFGFELLPIGQASAATTEGNNAPVVAPLRVVAFYDSVHFYQRGRKVHVIGGVAARIVSELVACAGPVHWEVVAREVWPDEVDALALRHRWDVALGRLRSRLRQASLRELVKADGGQVRLEVYAGDELEDRT